jgi:hypothetical protein
VLRGRESVRSGAVGWEWLCQRDLSERLVKLLAAVAPHRADRFAGEAFRVYPYQWQDVVGVHPDVQVVHAAHEVALLCNAPSVWWCPTRLIVLAARHEPSHVCPAHYPLHLRLAFPPFLIQCPTANFPS